MLSDDRPIFQQIADQLADGILAGTYVPGAPVPSTNELAAFHRINPATVGKGVNVLVDAGVLEKRRGLGMYVTDGARERLLSRPAGGLRPRLRRTAARGGPLAGAPTRRGAPLDRSGSGAMTETAIRLAGVTRRFGRTTALDDVTVDVPSGVVCGLLGRNGAGKTTLMSILAGHDRPSSGAGRGARQRPVRARGRDELDQPHPRQPALPGGLQAEARPARRAAVPRALGRRARGGAGGRLPAAVPPDR